MQGTNSDELDIEENERLELAGESEGDGWIRVRLKVSYWNIKYIYTRLEFIQLLAKTVYHLSTAVPLSIQKFLHVLHEQYFSRNTQLSVKFHQLSHL